MQTLHSTQTCDASEGTRSLGLKHYYAGNSQHLLFFSNLDYTCCIYYSLYLKCIILKTLIIILINSFVLLIPVDFEPDVLYDFY